MFGAQPYFITQLSVIFYFSVPRFFRNGGSHWHLCAALLNADMVAAPTPITSEENSQTLGNYVFIARVLQWPGFCNQKAVAL
jgi:hypothetical protein